MHTGKNKDKFKEKRKEQVRLTKDSLKANNDVGLVSNFTGLSSVCMGSSLNESGSYEKEKSIDDYGNTPSEEEK